MVEEFTKEREGKMTDERGSLKSALVGTGATLIPPEKTGEAERQFGDNYGEKELRYHPEAGQWSVPRWQAQLRYFRDILEEHGVRLVSPQEVPGAWMQAFTRDVGFTIGDTFYVPVMRHNIRRAEKAGIQSLYERLPFRVVELETPHLEGGDVFVHGSKVFVGISRQTTQPAFKELADHVRSEGYDCIPVECDESVLHLDCRFNIVNERKAVIIPDGVRPRGLDTLKEHFELVELSSDGLKTLTTNYVFVTPSTVLADSRNKEVAALLSEEGCEVIPLPFTEPTKAWGGPRCSICPLERA